MDKRVLLRVAVLWEGDVIDERTLDDRAGPVTLGPTRGATFVTPPIGDAARAGLLRPEGRTWRLVVPEGIGGEVTLAGRSQPAGELAGGAAVRLASGDSGRLELAADLALVFHAEPDDAPAVGRPPLLDWRFVAAVALSAVLHFGLVVPALRGWKPAPALELRTESEQVSQYYLVRTEKKEKPAEPAKAEVKPRPVEARPRPRSDRGPVDPALAAVKQRGVLPLLEKPSALRSLLARTDVNTQLDEALAGLAGPAAAASTGNAPGGAGAGGMLGGGGGPTGSALGGGGGPTFGQTYAGPDIATAGKVRTTPSRIEGRRERKVEARLGGGGARVEGELSKDQIDRVVRAHQGGIRYCYEKELQATPGLEGKVTLEWRIGVDGDVLSARVAESTIGNRGVEECLVRQVRRMVFPKPGGGQVVVIYPFIFRSTM